MYTSILRIASRVGCLALSAVAWCLVPSLDVKAQEPVRAYGQTQDGVPTAPDLSAAAQSAEAGMFLPSTVSARTDTQRGVVRALAGYDSARDRMQFEAVADVTLIGPVAARVGATYGQNKDSFRPTVGVRVQALDQARFGVDVGVGAFYKPEGFTQAEGEVEVMLMLARRFGRLATFANLVYGQDPEAAERDGELRLGALYAVSSPLQAGLDARLRFDVGSEEGKRRAEGGAEYDLRFGPTASYAFGPVALIAQAGLSIYGLNPAQPGALALLGMAGSL